MYRRCPFTLPKGHMCLGNIVGVIQAKHENNAYITCLFSATREVRCVGRKQTFIQKETLARWTSSVLSRSPTKCRRRCSGRPSVPRSLPEGLLLPRTCCISTSCTILRSSLWRTFVHSPRSPLRRPGISGSKTASEGSIPACNIARCPTIASIVTKLEPLECRWFCPT